jgi:hypothetical protein
MTLLVRPGFQFDADASTYIEAVEAADTQALETATRYAINNFVIGCKQDGIWSAIKASCILAGARTLSGALVPLAGTAPTNFNFVAGDYNRKTGLAGNGSTKYLNSNRLASSLPTNSNHICAYISAVSNDCAILGQGAATSGALMAGYAASTSNAGARNATSTYNAHSNTTTLPNLCGTSRSSSGSYSVWNGGLNQAFSAASTSLNANNVLVFAENNLSGTAAVSLANARLAFYSIGEFLDLALLDARVTTLINALAAAIP